MSSSEKTSKVQYVCLFSLANNDIANWILFFPTVGYTHAYQ